MNNTMKELTELEKIERWIKLGIKNIWIKEHNEDPDCLTYRDPPFDKDSFGKCETIEQLIEKLNHGNWCVGTAFYYENLCFINQINGGDEWMVIRNEVKFESISYLYNKGKYNGYDTDNFRDWLKRVQVATDNQLKQLDY